MIPSDTHLAMAELSGDLIFGKVPTSRYLYYINSSLEAGRSIAIQYLGKSAEELCRSCGVTVCLEDKPARCGGINLRAQAVTENKKTTIHIYRDSIQSLVENSSWEGVDNLNLDTAISAHLYHELFHALEEQGNSYVSDRLDCVETWKLLSWSGKSHVVRCSEIAAHSFAKEMLNLPWLTNFYDYIYLLNMKQLTPKQFADFWKRMQCLVDEGEGSNDESDNI